MNTIYSLLKQFLTENPWSRERCNKNKCIGRLLGLSPEQVAAVISYERIWRLVAKENVNLRGYDYDTKIKVEQEKKIELGYEVGYHNDVKQLGML